MSGEPLATVAVPAWGLPPLGNRDISHTNPASSLEGWDAGYLPAPSSPHFPRLRSLLVVTLCGGSGGSAQADVRPSTLSASPCVFLCPGLPPFGAPLEREQPLARRQELCRQANFLDVAGHCGPFGRWLSAPGPVPMGVVSAPGLPSRLRSAGAWDRAISHCKLTPNKPFLLHNSPPNSPFSPGASKPQVTLSGQMDSGLSS